VVIFTGNAVARLLSNGTPDQTFGTSGTIDLVDPLNNAGMSSTVATNVALDADDRILSGYGEDVVRVASQSAATLDKKGVLHVNGSDGNDVIGISAKDSKNIHVNINDNILKFTLTAVTKIDIELGAGVDTSDEWVDIDTTVNANGGGAGSESIMTGGGDDAITVFSPTGNIDGGAGDDHIHASGGLFTIHGSAGNDVIVAPAATSAMIFGDDGNDSLTGGPGDDSLFGGAGKDTLRGGPGNDLLDGNGGNDRIFGNDGNDHIHGDAGNDIINSVDGVADSVDGGAGTDTATVDNGIDAVTSVENVS
jgi:Ca2+-binding RTX toxin-like protein